MQPVYLDHAATSSPKAPGVSAAAAAFLEEGAGNAGRGTHALALRAAEAVEGARRELAALLSAPDPRRVALFPGATWALNAALRGLLRPGERVLVGPEAHAAVLRPLGLLEDELEVVVEEVATDDLLRWDLGDLERRLRAGPVALVAVAHGSNVTGAVQDLPAIGALARAHGARVLVDAAQTAGALPIPLDGVDLLAASGHKGLLGPTGTGFLWVREGIELRPFVAGGTGTRSDLERPPAELPAALEPGTQNALGFAALRPALAHLAAHGPALAARARASFEELAAGLAGLPGATVHAAGDLPLLSLAVQGWDPHELATALDGLEVCVRAGLHCAPRAHRRLATLARGGTVRVSPGPFLPPEAAREALARFREVLA